MQGIVDMPQFVVREHKMLRQDQFYITHEKKFPGEQRTIYVGCMYYFLFFNPVGIKELSWDNKLNFSVGFAVRKINDHIEQFIKKHESRKL